MNDRHTRKRLLEWPEYLDAVGTKGATTLVAGVGGLVGEGMLTAAAGAGLYAIVTVFQGDFGGALGWLVIGVVLALFGGVARWLSQFFFNEMRSAPPVGLLTKSSARSLPEEETLMRGSDRPSEAEQAELLRAARTEPETPPEQLLRSAQESRQDL